MSRSHVAVAVAAAEPKKVKPKLRGVSHQIAFFATPAACGLLMLAAPSTPVVWACLVYGLSLAGMFGISALYHRVTWTPAARRRMKRLDHAGIFLFIAGTYTPVCLVGIGPKAVTLLGIVWAGAAVGVLHALFFVHAFRTFNAVFYVVLGCAAVPYLPELNASLGPTRTALLGVGGALYIAGAAVYSRRWPNPSPRVFGYHEIFHLLVIAAGALHYAAILHLVRGAQ